MVVYDDACNRNNDKPGYYDDGLGAIGLRGASCVVV